MVKNSTSGLRWIFLNHQRLLIFSKSNGYYWRGFESFPDVTLIYDGADREEKQNSSLGFDSNEIAKATHSSCRYFFSVFSPQQLTDDLNSLYWSKGFEINKVVIAVDGNT